MSLEIILPSIIRVLVVLEFKKHEMIDIIKMLNNLSPKILCFLDDTITKSLAPFGNTILKRVTATEMFLK
jgi:hypothetical protein